MFRSLLIAKTIVSIILLTNLTNGHVIQRQGPAASTVTFTPCATTEDPLLPGDADAGLQCANFSVPLIHDQPTGAQVQLGLMKLPAKGQRIGNLFINPGGPGAQSTLQLTRFAEGSLPVGKALFNSFDIIAMDPRGVGRSSPAKCDTALSNSLNHAALDVTTADGLQALLSYNKALGDSCKAQMGALFDNMDTVAVAKDMELVRVAMGDEDMNYLGQSYGTQLGQQYAALFPSRIRAMLLDGNLQHTGDYTRNVLIQTRALDNAIQNFFDRCAANSTANGFPNCGPKFNQLRTIWAKVVDQAAAGKLQAPGCDDTPATGCFKNITVSNLLGGMRGLTESPGGQRRMAATLTLADTGNASFADEFANGLTTGSVYQQSPSFAIGLVQCSDEHFVDATRAPDPLANITALAAETRKIAVTPGMGEFFRRTVECSGLPIKVTNPRKALRVQGTKNPILLVHTTNDPATSPEYAQGMLGEIEGAVLLKRDGLGHTSYFSRGATTAAMNAYLVNLTVPAAETILST